MFATPCDDRRATVKFSKSAEFGEEGSTHIFADSRFRYDTLYVLYMSKDAATPKASSIHAAVLTELRLVQLVKDR